MPALLRAVSLFFGVATGVGEDHLPTDTSGAPPAAQPQQRPWCGLPRRAGQASSMTFQAGAAEGGGPFPSDDPSRSWRAAVRGSFPPEKFCLTLPAALVEEVGVGPAMPIVSKQQLISRGTADATTGVGRRGIRNSRSSRMGVAVLAPRHGALRNLRIYVHNQRRQVTTAV